MFETVKIMAMGEPVTRTSEKFQGISSPCVPVLHTLFLLHHQMQCTDSQRSRLVIVTIFKWMDHKKGPFNSIKKIYIMDIFIIYLK